MTAPDAADLLQAREELAEKIVAGKKVAGIDILACLDTECDKDTVAFLDDLNTLFRSLYHNNASGASFWLKAEAYLTKLAMRHIPDEAVEERAAHNEAERKENA